MGLPAVGSDLIPILRLTLPEAQEGDAFPHISPRKTVRALQAVFWQGVGGSIIGLVLRWGRIPADGAGTDRGYRG